MLDAIRTPLVQPHRSRAASLRFFAPFLTLLLMLAGASVLEAATPITYMVAEKPTRIAWPASSFPLNFAASNAPLIARNMGAVRQGFAEWQVASSDVHFNEGASRPLAAGRDQVNAVTVKDDLFARSGLVAFTSWWFDENTGALQEADIQIDPNAVNDDNIQRVVEHEVGHLLGLDHSGDLSSVMYPYVGKRNSPLSPDDIHGITALYPSAASAATTATMEGSVLTASGPVFGAHVVAVDTNGSPVATALTDADGVYELRGLPAGSYRIYTEPLDGPVEGRNLSGIYINASKNFRTSFRSANVNVAPASMTRGVDLRVDGTAPLLNPKWVGAFPAGSTDISLSSMTARLQSGSTIAIGIGGDGIVEGKTTFSVDSPLVKRVSDFKYGNGFLYATFEIGSTPTFTPLTVVVSSAGETAALTGALLVEPRSGRARPVR
jgi:predicted Zn-dependent protease